MVFIKIESLQTAHAEAIKAVLQSKTSDPELIGELGLFFEIYNPWEYAMSWEQNDENFIRLFNHIQSDTIPNQDMIDHYKERIDDAQLKSIIKLLTINRNSKKAILDLWKISDINKDKGSACMNYFWFRIINDELFCRLHMRACDIYNKFLADIAIACSTHKLLADELNIRMGKFELFTDCAHIYTKDYKKANFLVYGTSL